MNWNQILLGITFLFLQGCITWDSNEFEPTPGEVELAAKIINKEIDDVVDTKGCKKLGQVKIHAIAEGQPARVVAARKYKDANLIHHTARRMDGGINGEAPFNFYDVYRCP